MVMVMVRNRSCRSLRVEALERRNLLAASVGPAQLSRSPDGIWALTDEMQTAKQVDASERSQLADVGRYKLSILDADALAGVLARARMETQRIALPTPDGGFEQFDLSATEGSAGDTYSGRGVDEAAKTLHLQVSSSAIKARVDSSTAGYVVETYYPSDQRLYASYQTDGFGPIGDAGELQQLFDSHATESHDHEEHAYPEGLFAPDSGFGQLSSGDSSSSIDAGNENTVNLSVTSAHLRNGDGDAISNPWIGEKVAVQVNFTTSNLPANAFYEIHFSVDGVVLSTGTISAGAGLASGTWFYWWSGWYASPGTHNVVVTLDAPFGCRSKRS